MATLRERIKQDLLAPITLRSVVAVAILAGLFYVLIKEWSERYERRLFLDAITHHQSETDSALLNAQMAWIKFEESERRSQLQIEYMDRHNKQMDAFLQSFKAEQEIAAKMRQAILDRLATPAPRRQVRRKPPDRLKRCWKKDKPKVTRRGNVEIIEENLIRVPC